MSVYHPIMLCQPDACKSCGACCGQFNWKDHSREAIKQIIDLQTDLFLSLSNYDQLNDYQQNVRASIDNVKLFDTIYNCEFLGFIDDDRKKTGCMLHPEVTGRPDLRNHCFYGAEICESHFCPSFACLRTVEQQAVVKAIDDWYLYALVITDIDLVKEFFKHVENSIGEGIKDKSLDDAELLAVLHDFFSFKEIWKFKAKENRLGKYYFSEAEYNIARIAYQDNWGLPPSPYDKILVSLESEFATAGELVEAEYLIASCIQRFSDHYLLNKY